MKGVIKMSGTFAPVITDEEKQELTRHGTILFPVQQFHDDFSINDTVDWHWHHEFEAAIVHTGHITAYINQKAYELSVGDGFFINSDVLHSDTDLERTCVLDAIVFHPRLIYGSHDCIFWEKYVDPIISNRSFEGIPLYHDDPESQPLLTLIRKAVDLTDEKPDGYELFVRNHLSELIYQIYKLQPQYKTGLSNTAIRNEQRIKTMITFIEEHFQTNITLQDIANSAYISKSESIRCFNNLIKRTPIQFLKEYRLQKAEKLIVSTDMSISDIAYSCGFTEMSYFTRSFRKLYKETPTQYRKKNIR